MKYWIVPILLTALLAMPAAANSRAPHDNGTPGLSTKNPGSDQRPPANKIVIKGKGGTVTEIEKALPSKKKDNDKKK